jgi:ABC-2 type transport system permease protein
MTPFSSLLVLRGTLRYEARMAMRQRTLWYAVIPPSLLALVITWRMPSEISDGVRHVGAVTLAAGILCTLGIGVALADRMARGLSPGMGELIAATPGTMWTRLPALWAASLGVALVPPFLVVMMCAAAAAVADGGMRPPAAALAAFATVLVPGAAVVTALACLLGLVLPIPLARIITAGIWLWSTIASPKLFPLATPTGTLLSPVGGYPAAAWFGERTVWANRELTGPLSPAAGTGTALANLAVLAAFTLLFLTLAGLVAARRR